MEDIQPDPENSMEVCMTRNNVSPPIASCIGHYMESNLNLGAILTASTTCPAGRNAAV
jgi:hypothetical protein